MRSTLSECSILVYSRHIACTFALSHQENVVSQWGVPQKGLRMKCYELWFPVSLAAICMKIKLPHTTEIKECQVFFEKLFDILLVISYTEKELCI